MLRWQVRVWLWGLVAASCSIPAPTPAAQLYDAPSASGQAAWLQYGFDQRNTQRNPLETQLDRSSVVRLRERWRLHVPDGASSTPVVVEGTAYFGDWGGRVYALDAESGALRWQQRVTDGQVNGTPLVAADRLYVAGGASLIALARDTGALLYSVVLDQRETTMLWSSPKLVDGLLVIGIASFENGTSLQPTFTGSLVALEADSGKEVWRVFTTGTGPGRCTGGPGVAIWSSPSFDEELGLLYIGTGQGYDEPVGNCADSLLAIDYRRGTTGDRIRWIAQYSQGDVFGLVNLFTGPDGDVGGGPNLFEAAGRKLVGAGDKAGSYRVFDRKTGELVWRADLDMGAFVQFGGVVTTAAVDQDTIYVASNHMDSVQFMQGGDPTTDDHATLYALDVATGHERWHVQLPAPIAGTFALANGVIYHPLTDNRLYAREQATGAELWHAELQNRPGAGPSVVAGHVYVSAGMSMNATQPTVNGGFVSCFALDGAPLEAREAPVEMIAPLTQAQCLDTLSKQQKSTECSQCLCACDPTSAGHCGNCDSIASCTVLSCGLESDKEARRKCMEANCNPKLLPSFVFERALDLAPCMTQCALACGY